MLNNIAILLTCFNRKNKTLACLKSLYNSKIPKNIQFDVFLVDDGSKDGTKKSVKEHYPEVKIIQGSGDLFWAGGMRLAFEIANSNNNYDGYLLLNDDVVLNKNFFENITKCRSYCKRKFEVDGLYSSSTIDAKTGEISYGGHRLVNGFKSNEFELVRPSKEPKPCHLTNANILYVSANVTKEIGFFDKKFTHGIADYDFSLRAFKAGFPVYVTPGIGGVCEDDHGVNLSFSKSLKERIDYLMSPLGISYSDYLFYIKRHFPKKVVSTFIKLWLRTIFPALWKIKNNYNAKNNN